MKTTFRTPACLLATGALGFALNMILPAGSARADVSANIITATSKVEQTSSAGTNTFAGKVGIGTTAPAELLHVKSSGMLSTPVRIDNSSGNAMMKVSEGTLDGAPHLDLYGADGSTIRTHLTGGLAERSYFMDRLCVGTNTDSSATLHVRSRVLLSSCPLYLASTNNQTLFAVYNEGTDDAAVYACDSGTAKILFRAAGDSFLNGGKVGIGTNGPSEELHVTGQGRFDQGVTYVYPLGDVSMGSYTNQ